MQYLLNILIINSLFLFAFLNVTAQETDPVDSAIVWNTQKFRTILETAAKNYKDTVDIKKISEKAFNSMLTELDPYSNYLDTETYKNFLDNYSLNVKSLGINITQINDTIYVIHIIPGSPADSAGLIAGDKIIYLEGNLAVGMDIKTANSFLSVTENQIRPVNFIIKRPNHQGLLEFSLLPKELPIESVSAYFVIPETNIGYILSKRFSKSADSAFRYAVKSIIKQGGKSIIFDIRGHNGGQVDQAANIVDEFIPEGKSITYIKGKNNNYYQEYISESGQVAEKLPLIVLVDGNSMSAAEIFAGAIQDLDRGLLVGSITLGKGMAQRTWSFKDGSAFRLSVGDYYTPSGRNIQKNHHKNNIQLDPALKLKIGENKVSEMLDAINKYGGASDLPIHKTEKGRIVFGGGGIFPDYFAEPDTTTLLTQVLKQKNIVIESVMQFLEINRQQLLKTYGSNYYKFYLKFTVSDEMLAHLQTVSKMKNIWNDAMFETDKEYLRNYYKSLIAYFLWGNNAFYLNELKTDKVFFDAVEYLPEAIEMLN